MILDEKASVFLSLKLNNMQMNHLLKILMSLRLCMITSVICFQSLVMVFAQLMISNMPAVLDFLTNVPGPTGKPALEFVLTEWCSRQHLFYGNYERKVW